MNYDRSLNLLVLLYLFPIRSFYPVGPPLSPMEIEVKTYGAVRDLFDRSEFTYAVSPDSTVEDLLVDLETESDRSAEFGLLEGFREETVLVVRNGMNVKLLDGAETTLEDGDRLSLTSSPMPEG